jgi:uncharacterized protein YndB with AHSA1/START domain
MNTLLFDFSVIKETKTITIKREFAAHLPLVWDAFTKSELLDQWWAPKPWKAVTKTMDFREGGCWHYAMIGPERQEHWALVNYQSIIPQQRITAFDTFSDAEANVNEHLPQSKWIMSFNAQGEVTLYEGLIIFDNLEQLETTVKMGFQEGMTMALENLDKYFATQTKLENKR